MDSEDDRSSIPHAAKHALGVPTEPVAEITRVVQLVTQHRAALVRHVKRILGCGEDAEDVVQETCVRLMRVRDFWRGEREVRSFLFKIATNLARDELRRRRACAYGAHLPYDRMELAGLEPQPDEIVERCIAMEAVARAVMILPARHRQVFELHVDAQMSYRAISKHLGISTKTVERDIGCAREFCKYRLGVPGRAANWQMFARPPLPLAAARSRSVSECLR